MSKPTPKNAPSRRQARMASKKRTSPILRPRAAGSTYTATPAATPAALEDRPSNLLHLAGALMNSSRRDPHGRPPNVKKSADDAVFAHTPRGTFGAQLFVAARFIAAGEELLWDYKVC